MNFEPERNWIDLILFLFAASQNITQNEQWAVPFQWLSISGVIDGLAARTPTDPSLTWPVQYLRWPIWPTAAHPWAVIDPVSAPSFIYTPASVGVSSPRGQSDDDWRPFAVHTTPLVNAKFQLSQLRVPRQKSQLCFRVSAVFLRWTLSSGSGTARIIDISAEFLPLYNPANT